LYQSRNWEFDSFRFTLPSHIATQQLHRLRFSIFLYLSVVSHVSSAACARFN